MPRLIVRRRIPLKVLSLEVVEPDGKSLGTTTVDHVVDVHVPIPDSNKSGLNATSTGTKYTSVFRFKWYKALLKKVTIRATWSASATDSVEKICVKDLTSGNDIVCVSGNAGTDQEASTTDLASVTDGGLWTVYSAVTTASATTTATYNISYIVVELEYEYKLDNIAQWQ